MILGISFLLFLQIETKDEEELILTSMVAFPLLVMIFVVLARIFERYELMFLIAPIVTSTLIYKSGRGLAGCVALILVLGLIATVIVDVIIDLLPLVVGWLFN